MRKPDFAPMHEKSTFSEFSEMFFQTFSPTLRFAPQSGLKPHEIPWV